MKRIGITVGLILFAAAQAAAHIPWNSTVNTITPSGGAATCSLPAVCIFNLTGNLTSLTLNGGTSGASYSLIFVQDHTGGRTFTIPSNIVAGAVTTAPTIPSGADAWTVWVVRANGPNYQLQAVYDGLPIFDVYTNTYQSLGTALATRTSQLQVRAPSTVSVIFPGMTINNACYCVAQLDPSQTPHNLPPNWQTGVTLACIPDTNAATCLIINATATSLTPDQDALNIRGQL